MNTNHHKETTMSDTRVTKSQIDALNAMDHPDVIGSMATPEWVLAAAKWATAFGDTDTMFKINLFAYGLLTEEEQRSPSRGVWDAVETLSERLQTTGSAKVWIH